MIVVNRYQMTAVLIRLDGVKDLSVDYHDGRPIYHSTKLVAKY